MAWFRAYAEYRPFNPALKINSMDSVKLADAIGAEITDANASHLHLTIGPDYWVSFTGYGLTYDANSQLSQGTITTIELYNYAGFSFTLNGLSLAVPTAVPLLMGSNAAAFTVLLAGSDDMVGSGIADLLRGYGGADTMQGGTGADSLFGGAGNDVIYGGGMLEDAYWAQLEGANYLRGEDGNDTIYGSFGFDDIQGNMGDDVEFGAGGNDWVVGGKGNDKLSGDAGDDVVYGNMGADTVDGGAGADWVRGGQDDDVLLGGDGNDWLSGDKGSDTLTGGAGADVFHSSAGAGLDRIVDFSRAEGDRILLDVGTVYSLRQSGADTVIDMGGGDHVVLVGVSLSSLSGDWLSLG